jgi:hypothetical protein
LAKTAGALALASYDDIFRASDTVMEANTGK